MSGNTWPTQAECDTFYGDPRGPNGGSSVEWESKNLIALTPCFQLYYVGKPVRSIRVHKKVAESLADVFHKIWERADRQQSVLDDWGVSIYGGAYNYRLMRNGNALSMHSYGCAIDLDPGRNGLGDTTPNFANHPLVVEAFESEGWVWGGRWSGRSCDGMHFQAARVR